MFPMEGMAMRTRYLLIASAALAATAAANAEPAKPEPRAPAAQPANRPAEVILASADQVQASTPAVQGQSATPVKRPRAARVTTCRCGDQAASER